MKQFYRVTDVAPLLGVTEQTLRNWIREGKIAAKRFGRPHLIPLGEIARLLDRTPDEVAKLLEPNEPDIRAPNLQALAVTNRR